MIKHYWLNSICFKFNTTISNSTDLNSALHEEVYVDFCGTLYCNFGRKNAYHFHGMFCHDFQVPQCYKLSVHIFCRVNFAFLHQTPIPLTHLSVSYQYRFQKTITLFPPLQSNSVNIARTEQKNMIHVITGVFQKRGILILSEGMWNIPDYK